MCLDEEAGFSWMGGGKKINQKERQNKRTRIRDSKKGQKWGANELGKNKCGAERGQRNGRRTILRRQRNFCGFTEVLLIWRSVRKPYDYIEKTGGPAIEAKGIISVQQ